jgi:nucleotide-binding universal stress UspA family protein
VLAEPAGPDDLVVVGTRSRGGVAGLLGSVSREVVHDARCPVVFVPSSVADGRR